MNTADLRAQLEEDLAWRLDELRHLRNSLLGSIDRENWPVAAVRAILVMQYAHLEGFTRHAFSVYVAAINHRGLSARDVQASIFASALVAEFDALRLGSGGDQESDEGRLTRRAKTQVDFVEKLRQLNEGPLAIDASSAVSMEMNFGRDVLRRTLYRLGIPEDAVSKEYYSSLEFVRNMRNDIAHGTRKNRIEPGVFEAHRTKCEAFMNDLARVITLAVTNEWYKCAS